MRRDQLSEVWLAEVSAPGAAAISNVKQSPFLTVRYRTKVVAYPLAAVAVRRRIVEPKKIKSELTRLLKLQNKAKQEEVFGGFSGAENREFDRRTKRINALEIELHARELRENDS